MAKLAEIVPHGTIDYGELRSLGLQPQDLFYFSSNINPFGPPPAVVSGLQQSINSEMIARYPDRLCLELREILAAHHALSIDSILVGNGTADLMWLVGLVFMRGARVAILGPTFGEYRHVAEIMGGKVIDLCHPEWVLSASGFNSGSNTLTGIGGRLQHVSPDVVVICNPNNPTGQVLTADELTTLYAAAPDALWMIDEAYAEFLQHPTTSAAEIERGNWLVLRSMTKDFALGGLRLGYLLGAPQLVGQLQAVQSPWNVNLLAQLAGCISLREGISWRAETIGKLLQLTVSLQLELQRAGYSAHPTNTNYFLVPVQSGTEVRRALLARRLVVRDCTSFGLPHHIRIATQLPDANQRLVEAMVELAPEALPVAAR